MDYRSCTHVGVRSFSVNSRFHLMSVGWNLGLTLKLPTPTHGLSVVNLSTHTCQLHTDLLLTKWAPTLIYCKTWSVCLPVCPSIQPASKPACQPAIHHLTSFISNFLHSYSSRAGYVRCLTGLYILLITWRYLIEQNWYHHTNIKLYMDEASTKSES